MSHYGAPAGGGIKLSGGRYIGFLTLSLSLSLSLWRSADAAAEPTKWVSIWNASDVVRGGVEKGVAAPIDIIPVYRRF